MCSLFRHFSRLDCISAGKYALLMAKRAISPGCHYSFWVTLGTAKCAENVSFGWFHFRKSVGENIFASHRLREDRIGPVKISMASRKNLNPAMRNGYRRRVFGKSIELMNVTATSTTTAAIRA
jgi:hypothetical protein